MPDNNMIGFDWIVLCHFGGRTEKVECHSEAGFERYLKSLLENPRKTHPDIALELPDRELTAIDVYRKVTRIETKELEAIRRGS